MKFEWESRRHIYKRTSLYVLRCVDPINSLRAVFDTGDEYFSVFETHGETTPSLREDHDFPKELKKIKDKKAYVEVFMRLICA